MGLQLFTDFTPKLKKKMVFVIDKHAEAEFSYQNS